MCLGKESQMLQLLSDTKLKWKREEWFLIKLNGKRKEWFGNILGVKPGVDVRKRAMGGKVMGMYKNKRKRVPD